MDDRTVNGNGHNRKVRVVGARTRTRANGQVGGARPERPQKPEAYTLYLERQLRSLRDALTAARDGDLSVRLPAEQAEDVVGQAAWALNGLLDRGDAVTREVARVSRVFARDGRSGERASIGQLSGSWSSCIDGLNIMLGEVAWRTQEVASVIEDVAEGDLSHKMPLEFEGRPLQGDALRAGKAVNQLVDRLRLVSSRGDPRGPRGRHRGQAGRSGRRAGRRPAPGRTSPTTSTCWPAT